MNDFQTLKPKLPKRYLLFVASFLWTFTGGMYIITIESDGMQYIKKFVKE